MDYYVSKRAGTVENGTLEQPFSTIGQATAVAEPGDTIWIGGGVYREWVRPVKGGTDSEHRIVYKKMPGEQVIISGAEEVKDWVLQGNDIWKAVIPGKILKDYNPYTDSIYGDWYDGFGQIHHTGEIFMDDMALYEAPDLEHIKQEDKPGRKFNWFAVASEEETELWVYLPGRDPNKCKMEASVRPSCFFPEREGINYITVSGLIIEKAATQWAPPTAFQPGAIGVHWSKGWIIEDCIVRNSKCAGISIGKRHDEKDNIWSIDPSKGGAQTYTEIVFSNLKRDWKKENVGSHIIRNNEIYDCGQAGIVGCMGCIYSGIYNNHIYDINIRKEFGGAEMAGIKLHGAIDVRIEKNLIHDCIRALWLDWEAQGTRVTGNTFFGNVKEDLFIEVCHGPCTVDNNIFLSEYNVLNVSQGTAYIHNLFTGKVRLVPEPNRFTLYHFPHDTFIAGSMIIYGGDDRVYNNIYIGKEQESGYGNVVYNGYADTNNQVDTSKGDAPMSYVNTTLPVSIHGNLYFNNAKKWEHESDAVEVEGFHAEFQIVHSDNKYYLETNLAEYKCEKQVDLVTTDMLGRAFESEAAYENADGTPFVIDRDFIGERRRERTISGPFAVLHSRILLGRGMD